MTGSCIVLVFFVCYKYQKKRNKPGNTIAMKEKSKDGKAKISNLDVEKGVSPPSATGTD